MISHRIATRQQWLTERLALLEAEKELTRQSDALARRRQALPWVRIEKDYQFQTDDGPAPLEALFRGRSQLLVYHFMFGPEFAAGCPSCSAIADGFNGIVTHLANHDVLLTAVSLAPLGKLQAFKRRMGWTFPWASSVGGDFNFDFCASFTEAQQQTGIEYNFIREPSMTWGAGEEFEFARACGVDTPTYLRQRPGMSAFIREDGAIYHTYSTYSRGLDALWGMYSWLDRAPLGRNEADGIWWRHHDRYDETPTGTPSCCHTEAA
jgi:predicted dithiol-disulfide oxidoreductase (DUF899 family)